MIVPQACSIEVRRRRICGEVVYETRVHQLSRISPSTPMQSMRPTRWLWTSLRPWPGC